MRDEAIHNQAKSKFCNGIFKSKILDYGLPRKFYKLARNNNNNIGSMRNGLPQFLSGLLTEGDLVKEVKK